MGRPSDEFWSLSYREIFACVEAHIDEIEERRMLFGTLVATELTIATEGKKTFAWTDIFPSRTPAPTRDPQFTDLNAARDAWRLAHSIAGSN